MYSCKNVEWDSEEAQSFFNEDDIPKLSFEQQQSCEGLLTVNECYEILCTFKSNKSPGNDGLTAEFYKQWWHLFGATLVNSLNKSYEAGELSNSQKQGVITLILKSRKDKRLVSSYRPITLLNVDMKIGSKTIAARLSKVLPNIINRDQAAFVSDRYIGDAVRSVADIIHYTNYKNIPGLLLNIDFEKAYDSVDHKYLSCVLKLFNFGDSIQRWAHTLYKNIQSCVMNGGFSTGYFDIIRGVRQGDPLSSILFVAALEILLIKIRNDDNIKGIEISSNINVKLSCYADDLTCFLSDIDSANNVLNVLEQFHSISSLKVNVEKTEAMWLGRYKHSTDCPLPVKWTNYIKVLGIFFSYDEKLAISLNFDDKIRSLKQVLALWKNRDLTVIGKILIIKTFGLSKFLYVLNMISTPISVQKQINSIVHQFIWNGPDKIKRSVLSADYENGGLKMVDIVTKIKTQQIMWLKRFIDGNETVWKLILDQYLKRVGGLTFLLKCNFDIKKLKCHIPPFYENILNAWVNMNASIPNGSNEVCKEVIWNNKYILVNNEMVFNNTLISAGIIYINDLLTKEGKFSVEGKLGDSITHNDYIKLLGIIHAIPRNWKNQITSQTIVENRGRGIGSIIYGTFVLLRKMSSKLVYRYLVDKNSVTPVFKRIFMNKYNITEDDCRKLLMLPWKTTLDTRSRWFQYRINHFILPTKQWLHKIQKINSPNCDRCGTEVETLNHLFIECDEVNMFWENFRLFWNVIFPNLSFNDKLFGILDEDNENWRLKNQLLLSARRYIFIGRCRGSPLSIDAFNTLLKSTERLEEMIARDKDKLDLHIAKWSTVNMMFH